MKFPLLILFLLFLQLPAFAQTAVLSTERTKALYRSVDNEVHIAVPGYRCGEIELESPNCTVKGGGCRYVVVPGEVPKAILIVRDQKRKTIIDSIQVPVWPIPNSLSVKIASGKENKGLILKDGPFLISEEGPVPDALFRIVSFEVTLVRKDRILYQGTTKGSHFDAAAIAAIALAQAGDRLFLNAIQVLGPGDQKRFLSAVAYTFR